MTTIYIALNEGAALGGLLNASVNLGDVFAAHGYDVRYLTVSGEVANRSSERLFPSFLSRCVPRRLFTGMKLQRLDFIGQLLYRARLKNRLLAAPGDLICMDVFSAQLSKKVRLPPGAKKVFQFHNSYVAVERSRELNRIRSVALSFDVCVALTEVDAEGFARSTGIPFVTCPNVLQFRIAQKANSDEKIVYSIGRLVPSKRVDLVIEAWSKLKLEDWQLRIVGDGPEFARLKQLARDLELQSNVSFLGRRQDIEVLLNEGSIYVLCSAYEGLPMGIVEAMSQGLACIISRSSPGAEELALAASAILTPVGDVDALASALGELTGDRDRRMKMGQIGIDASHAYRPETVFRRWEEILNV